MKILHIAITFFSFTLILILQPTFGEYQSGSFQIVNNTVNDCDKKINSEKESLLGSIDKQKAILLAESDKDFLGLVGDSKYITGGPSVEANVDYNQCQVVNPTIQIQFNVLTPNTNLNNCPYVIVIEDPSASKVLAVDLGRSEERR